MFASVREAKRWSVLSTTSTVALSKTAWSMTVVLMPSGDVLLASVHDAAANEIATAIIFNTFFIVFF